MIICEMCGSAITELDEQCRVCGNAFVKDEGAPQPVAVQSNGAAAMPVESPPVYAAPVAQAPEPPTLASPAPPEMPVPPPSTPSHYPGSAPDQRALGMSAVAPPVEATAPPMLHGSDEPESPVSDPGPGSAVPSFMLAGNRTTAPAPEPVQLISANDLPEWIKQIAAADAEKAAAESMAAQAQAEAPATIVKKALPGETQVVGGSTAWLSKSGQTTESPDHWAATEVANAHWGNVAAGGQDEGSPDYPTIIPPTAFVPSAVDSGATTRKKGLSFSSKRGPRTPKAAKMPKSTSVSSGQPIYRRQTVQLAALVALVAVLAVFLLI